MTNVQWTGRNRLLMIATLCCLAVVSAGPEARAEIIINNLDQSDDFVTQGQLVGAAIQLGATSISLASITYSEQSFGGPTPGESFAVYGRNMDGTLGGFLFNDFTLTTDNDTFLTTATANTSFVLSANSSYWLVMVETTDSVGGWDASASTSYTSSLGVTMPSTDTSFAYNGIKYTYLDLSDGPQLYNVIGSAVPEPTSLALTVTASAIGLAGIGLRRRFAAA